MSKASVAEDLLRKGTKAIADWKWRPMSKVRQELSGLESIDPYITGGYGDFMREQAGKSEMSPRDMVKAYTITRSSVGRTGRNITDDLVQGKGVRPEGYFSEWLLSPQGQNYLDAAEQGTAHGGAIDDAVARFRRFGKAPGLGKEMEWAATAAPDFETDRLMRALRGPKDEWRAMSDELPGIGPAKSGFLASLLGRGDIPTLDARQIKLHTGRPTKEAGKYTRRQGGAGGHAAVDRLASRQKELELEAPSLYAPQYQHLAHHAVWDALGGTKTTHSDLVRAMQRGQAKPAVLGGVAAGGALTDALIKALQGEPDAP